jgi:radical SAM superfamily enzyme YgiQ (UPF0313 family)
MAESASDFRWVCNLKVDRIKLPDLETLWTGGCRGFFVGVESASQETLDRVGKGVVLAEELDVIRRAIDMGFLVSFSGNVTYPKARNLRDVAAALRQKTAATIQRLAELDSKARGICEAIRVAIPSPQRVNDARIEVITARQALLQALQTM